MFTLTFYSLHRPDCQLCLHILMLLIYFEPSFETFSKKYLLISQHVTFSILLPLESLTPQTKNQLRGLALRSLCTGFLFVELKLKSTLFYLSSRIACIYFFFVAIQLTRIADLLINWFSRFGC